MKKLNRDFTTPAQSKRLLELGVPASSANCYIDKDGKVHCFDGDTPKSLMFDAGCIPCWTTGRLIEIHTICGGTSSSYYVDAFPTCIQNEVIYHLADAVRNRWINFSKLENIDMEE